MAALTQQTVPWIEDGRISHEDPPQHSSYHKEEHSQDISTILPADQSHSSQTEERGCSPITVLEARHTAEEIAGKPHARGRSHTSTTTTSWGAPLLATTNIQIEDDNSPHCLQFILHSESRVTLHAPKDVIQDLQHVKQQQEQKQPRELYETSGERKCNEGTSDSLILGESCKGDNEPEERFDKLLDTKFSKAALEEIEEVETRDLKYTEFKQRECSDGDMLYPAKIEMMPFEITRVEDVSEVDSTSVMSLSNDEIFPRGMFIKEAKGETPDFLDGEVPATLGDNHDDQAANEVTPSSAHRPTTLMITSNSNESSDDAECTTNDPARFGGENDISQDLKQEGGMAGENESKQEESDKKHPTAVSEQLLGNESGAVPRLERPIRSSPRTTTLVKVKVEKRPVGSHSQVRDRNSHDHLTVVHAHSVEEEMRGLMQEVKEATSQIKQEVKELRQADTPTPDTPTPLREFKEFLNREEEQEQERLPTIKEICRENEEDSSAGMGGEHMRDEYFHLKHNTPVHEPSLPEQLPQPGFYDKSNPDSGYSTMEGYYAKSVDPAQTAKYSPSCCEMVPEGSFDEHIVKSELESSSSHVDTKNLFPVVCNVDGAVSTVSEKQSKSKFKSFLKKVCKFTSKGGAKYEARNNDGKGELTLDRDTNKHILKTKDHTIEDGKASGMAKEKEEIQSQLNIDNLMQAESIRVFSDQNLEEDRSKSSQYNDILQAPEESHQCFVENIEKNLKDIDLSISYSPITPAESELPVTDPPVSAVHYISTTSIKELYFREFQMPDIHESQTILPISSFPVLEDEEDVCGQMKEAQGVFLKVSDPNNIETPEEGAHFMRYENLENLPLTKNLQPYDMDVQLSKPEKKKVKQPEEKENLYHKESELLPVKTSVTPLNYILPEPTTEQHCVSFSAKEYTDDVRESDLKKIDYFAEFENAGLGATVPDSDINSMPIYNKTFHKFEEIEEETTSFNQQMPMLTEISLLRKGSHIPKLSEVNKFSLSEEEYDDYIDLPDTDIVEIMETVIEVDETDESDEMHQEEKETSESKGGVAPVRNICSQKEKYNIKVGDETNMEVETWKAKKKKKEQQTSCVEEEEIQLLSEDDTETINDSLNLSKENKSYDSSVRMESKIASDIVLLSQDQEKGDEIKLQDSSVAGEACLLELEEDCQGEIDETKKAEEFKIEIVDRAREISEHILRHIEGMDVGNRQITDIVAESDTDFDFKLESGYKIPAFKEIDSEMEMSFSDDIPVRVPELSETDSWLQTIKAYQSLTSKTSVTCGDNFSVLESKKEKQANLNANETNCDWLLYMKNGRNISCEETKESEAASEKAGDDDIMGTTSIISEDVKRRDAAETVTYECKPSNADYVPLGENSSQPHSQEVEVNTQSPYKVCLYTSDGQSLHLKGILEEEEKLSLIHDETTSEIVDSKKNSSCHENFSCENVDNLKNIPEYIAQNVFTSDNDREETLSNSGKIVESEVTSVKQESDFVCEINIPEDHMLAASKVCLEVGKMSVTVHESDPYSNEDKFSSQGIIDVEDPAVPHFQKIEAVVDSRMELLANENDKRSTVMTSVSEELKAIISTLECTLIAGEGRHLQIGPLMERLDEMEKEIIDLNVFEASESSIPASVDDLNIHCLVFTSQTSTPTEEVKMPVGLEIEAATLSVPGGPSPTGEMNGQDVQEALTDIEELHSEGDTSPMPKRKSLLSAPKQDEGALTDTEDMDLSGEEEDIIPERKNLPTIQDMGLLEEPVKEVINLTEGYAREPSPLHGSDSEPEKEDVQGRHRKNVQKVDTLNELSIPIDDVAEALTDVEDMVASGEEDASVEVEDSLPDYYMAQGEDVSNKEDYRVVLPTPKIFVTQKDDSTDEEETSKEHRSKSRSLKVDAVQEGTTDVEDLDVSDKDVSKKFVTKSEVVAKDKVRRKKQIRKKAPSQKVAAKALPAPSQDTSCLTDIEVLTGDENTAEDDFDVGIPEDELDEPTDSEDVEASDTDVVEDLIPKPVEKMEQPLIPEPHRERIKISDVEERAEEESGAETDEEGFELNDKEDERPLIPRKKVIHEPLNNEENDALDIKEADEVALTDTEDFDIEEKEEKEVMDDILNRIPKESEIYSITEMEASMGKITKKEMIRDIDAELKRKIKEAERAGITIQAAMEEECLTDVEDLDATEESEKPKKKVTTVMKNKKKDDETDEESVNESDIEEEIVRSQKNKKRSKRLPIAPQLSEVRFVETETGPLSIIITPDSKIDEATVENVSGIAFIESENDDATTDVEDISDGEETKALKTTNNKPEPLTDTEDLDLDPIEVNRPRSPLPPHLKYNVLQSPKRELVYIKEDKHGVPQVTVRKLRKDELFVSDIEDPVVTDTEDIDVSEEEAIRLAGATSDATSDFELSDSGNTEVASKLVHKMSVGEPDEEEGTTDVEELVLSKRPRHKAKVRSRLLPTALGDDSNTDIESLSDQDCKENIAKRTARSNSHTDVEDFDHSDNDTEEPDRFDAPTPDIIRDAAIRKTVILKESPRGNTYTEDATVASSKLLDVEAEPEGTTDVEDIEVSGAEDDGQPEHPAVDLPDYEASSVDISERSSLPSTRNEEKHVKDNLLLPEDNFNNVTDVESLGEGEGNRCASNTSLLSGQQLTCAVESCFVDKLFYPSPATDPKLCIHPGLSIESDPFCAELTTPIVVEAELELVYYHTPQDRPQQTEVEHETNNGCVIRRRQVVASLYQAREIRRFWLQDENSPLRQSEIEDFTFPASRRKEFKTILYLEQPNLLDTISISDTLCDPEYFKKERLLDFDSSSIDSFEDERSYKDSDVVTVIDHFDLDRSCSFDDLPSPHLSSISSTVIGSSCSGRSFYSDPQFFGSFCSTPLLDMAVNTGMEGLQSTNKSASLGFLRNDIPVESCSLNNVSVDKDYETCCSNEEKFHKEYYTVDSDPLLEISGKYEVDKNPILDFSGELINQIPQVLQTREWDSKSNAASLTHATHFKENCDPKSTLKHCSTISPPFRAVSHNLNARNSLIIIDPSQDSDVHINVEESSTGNSESRISSIKNLDICIKSEDRKQHQQSNYDNTSVKDSKKSLEELFTNHPEDFKNEEELRLNEPCIVSCTPKNYDNKSHKILSVYPSYEYRLSSDVQTGDLNLNCPSILQTQNKKEFVVSSKQTVKNIQEYSETQACLNVSIDNGKKLNSVNYEKELIIAESVFGHEETGTSSVNMYSYHDLSSTFDSENALISTIPTCTQNIRQITQENTHRQDKIHKPTVIVPLIWRHTLPRVNRARSDSMKNRISDKFHQIKDFVGVRDLIGQWEEIVEEEKRRSLPASPAGGRKVMPPFEEKRPPELPSIFTCDSETRKSNENEDKTEKIFASQKRVKDSIDDNNVVEQVASVYDIIQQFEGKFAQCDKQNILRLKSLKSSQSPSNRGFPHYRQVATVKPLREFQLKEENKSTIQEVNVIRHCQDSMEGSHMAGLVPGVMESLSITKSLLRAKEEDPPIAGVLCLEGEPLFSIVWQRDDEHLGLWA